MQIVCQISTGFCVPKIIKIGSFLSELFINIRVAFSGRRCV